MTLGRVVRAAVRDSLLPARYVAMAWRTRSLNDAKAVLRGCQSWNTWVYEACQEHDVPIPDMPVRDVEFYGQCGEDVVVRSILEAKAVVHGVDLREKRYLEIGGCHPFANSATFLLSQELGMTGVIVEPNTAVLPQLREGRPADLIVHAAVSADDADHVTLWVPRFSNISSLDRSFVSRYGGHHLESTPMQVPAKRINDIVRDHLEGQSPVFMSIDVEGIDWSLLTDFDFVTYRPWLVQVEPSDDHIPGNTRRMIGHMRSADYALIAQTSVNLIFIDTHI